MAEFVEHVVAKIQITLGCIALMFLPRGNVWGRVVHVMFICEANFI